MFGIALLLDKITECATSGTCSADTLVDYNWSDLALFWAVVVLKNLLGEDIILFFRPLTHGVQFLVWEHQRPVGGEGVMVREAFRKYCKKSETIDHVKIYKCCRENYTQIPTQTQHKMHCHAHIMRTECLIEHYSKRHSDYLGRIIKVWDKDTRII